MKRIIYLLLTLTLIIIALIIIPDKKSEFTSTWLKYGEGYSIGDFPEFSDSSNLIIDDDLKIYENDKNRTYMGRVLIFTDRRVYILSPNGNRIGIYFRK